jgi:hypothetical protein
MATPSLRVLPTTADTSEPLRAPVRIGKDILGLLSTAMYVEPLSIVREYVQNAADSIDVAYDSNILASRKPGKIEIRTDSEARSLVVRDNGVGIERRNVEEILVAFGLSGKRGTSARGFRGVGRLGGLGFAQRVVFRTRFVGEPSVSEVAWDCRALRAILLDNGERSDLADVVHRVVSVRKLPDDGAPEHFFEVELERLARVRNDRLLNPIAIVDYLRQVAPLPLSPSLLFNKAMSDFVEEFVPRRRIDICVNDSDPLTRPHRTQFVVSGTKQDKFSEVEQIKIHGIDGGLAAIGWILHHSYLGALKASTSIRGLRARVGDIQIGDDSIFAQAFPEPRFNTWVVGELHILDRGIIPNGRRDDFETTAAYSHLLSRLLPLGRALAHRCRSSSMERTRLRQFETYEQEVLAIAKRVRQRRITGRRKEMAVRDAKTRLAAMEKLLPGCSTKRRTVLELGKRLRGCQTVLGRSRSLSNQSDGPLAILPSQQRAALEEFLAALHACVSPKKVADALEERLIKRLVRHYTS